MTVVAVLQTDDGLALVSDLLLTTDVYNGVDFLPTLSDASERMAGAYFLSGLHQKIVIINDRVTVCWAGFLDSARVLIRFIEDNCQKSRQTQDEFRAVTE